MKAGTEPTDRGASAGTFRFQAGAGPDGAFESPAGRTIPIPAPDWDRALELLYTLNTMRDSSGKRISASVEIDGFEPWWYSQDRLLRFFLLPLVQLLPFLDAVSGQPFVRIENAPPDFQRLLAAVGGRNGFPMVALVPPGNGGLRFTGRLGWLTVRWFSYLSLAAFRIARRDTVFYIVDHVSPGLRGDFRFEPLYREMAARGIRFTEFAHTLSPRQALGNFLRRRRPVFLLEAADDAPAPAGEDSPCETDTFRPEKMPVTVEERALCALVPTVLGWCRASAARQQTLRRALVFQRAKRAVIFDDNRHNHELTAACRSLGIPVLGFQHGVFNKFHAGLMANGFGGARSHAFDRYGLWSGLFCERLLQHSSLYGPERVFVSGPVRGPAAEDGGPVRTPSPQGRIRVLVVSEPLARKAEVAEYLRAGLEDPAFEWCFKLRPGESEAGLAEYRVPAGRARILRTATVYEAFRQVDVVAGTYSTVLYEAALALTPAVWMRTTRAYGRELAEETLAEEAARPEEFARALRKAAALADAERQRRRSRIWGERIVDGAAALMDALATVTPHPDPDAR